MFFITYLTLSCFTAPRWVQGPRNFGRMRCVCDIKLNVLFLQETVSMESNHARHLCKYCFSKFIGLTCHLLVYCWCITFVISRFRSLRNMSILVSHFRPCRSPTWQECCPGTPLFTHVILCDFILHLLAVLGFKPDMFFKFLQHQVSGAVSGHHSSSLSPRHHLQLPDKGWEKFDFCCVSYLWSSWTSWH